MKDNRNDIVYELRISQLAPLDANIIIQGQLNIELEGTGITNNSQEQSATFDIYLKRPIEAIKATRLLPPLHYHHKLTDNKKNKNGITIHCKSNDASNLNTLMP